MGHLAMNERNLLHLFTDLQEVLTSLVTTYPTDNLNLSATETQCLGKLKTIATELTVLLKDQLSIGKFTLNKYETFIDRIGGVRPPEIVKTQKSSGFFGIGASVNQERISSPLADRIKKLLERLDATLKTERERENKEREKASEKSLRTEEMPREKEVVSEKSLRVEQTGSYVVEKPTLPSTKMEEIEQKLMALTQRVETSEQLIKQAYQNGWEQGRQKLMLQFRDALKCLEGSQQEKILLLLQNGEPKAKLEISALPAVFNSEGPKVKDEDQEKQKAKQWIGDAKFPVVEKLVDLHNLRDVSKIEKLVAKWVIFELMVHKYDQSISGILDAIKNQLSNSYDLTKFPHINAIFETDSNSNQESISTQKLSQKELDVFFQLVNNQGFYLPQDGTAANYFASHLKQAKEEKVTLTTKEQYRENVVGKIGKELKTTPKNAF